MNTLVYYNRQKDIWGHRELDDIRNEYEGKGMTISQIADIHRRTPGSISYKLKFLGILKYNTDARGYLEYKNSKLYKEIIENSMNSTDRKIYTDKQTLRLQRSEMPADILQMKADIKEVKEKLDKLLKFFENIQIE